MLFDGDGLDPGWFFFTSGLHYSSGLSKHTYQYYSYILTVSANLHPSPALACANNNRPNQLLYDSSGFCSAPTPDRQNCPKLAQICPIYRDKLKGLGIFFRRSGFRQFLGPIAQNGTNWLPKLRLSEALSGSKRAQNCPNMPRKPSQSIRDHFWAKWT